MADAMRQISELTGYFKTNYLKSANESVYDVVDESIRFAELVEFDSALGKDLKFPVLFSLEQGFTHGAESEDYLAYNDAQSAVSQEATLGANQIYLKSLLTYKTAARSMEGGGKAFKAQTKHLVTGMVLSFKKRREILHWYGKDGLGTIETITDSGSDVVLTLSKATFAPGMWVGMENARVDVLLADKSDFTDATARNLKIKTIDIDNRNITVEAVAHTVFATGEHLYFAKTSEDSAANFSSAGVREMAGVKKILTTSGSLFGISNTTYGMWKGTEYDAGTAANLSFEIVQKAAAKGAPKGLSGKVSLFCNTYAWSDLIVDEAAARRLDSSYKRETLENGSQQIVFHAANCQVQITPHSIIKGGDAFIINPKDWSRVGSVEMSFEIPSLDKQIFVPLTTGNAYMIVLMGEESIYCLKPAAQVYIKDLSYSL